MEMPRNEFKRRLGGERVQYGMWVSLADPVAAEIAAGAGFDWLVIDGEHAPNDLRTVLHQLQATGGSAVSPIVRTVVGSASLLKQVLDLGAQTVLVPMVESADQASALVAATRYPPAGTRGVATARAARWGRIEGYWEQADRETCLVVQIETRAGVDAVEAIAAVDGVDALFVGPSDLGASLGHLGRPHDPAVRDAVCEVLGRISSCGKAAGVLATDPAVAAQYVEAGATFVGVGVDTAMLAAATSALADRWRATGGSADGTGG